MLMIDDNLYHKVWYICQVCVLGSVLQVMFHLINQSRVEFSLLCVWGHIK